MSDRDVTFDIIVKAVCAIGGMTRHELMRDTRREEHVRLRFAAWWLASKMTSLSFSTIGRLSNGRDHTSIISGVARCDEIRAGSESYRADTDAMLATLTALERHGLLSLAGEHDPLATARRVLAAPEREAVRVSTYEIIAMASLIATRFGESDDPTPSPVSPSQEIEHAA